MDADEEWALSESSKFFQGKGSVQESLRRITRRLDELHISYAVVGGLALFYQGFRRYTEDVDLLVTSQGLSEIHKELEGLGYLPPFRGSKQLRDMTSGVKIEFLIAGGFPGDGKPKPVAFPDPQDVGERSASGVVYVNLPTLVELKLASGMTAPGRLKDLSDILELIRAIDLPMNFVDRLSPYVRAKYAELWQAAADAAHDEHSE